MQRVTFRIPDALHARVKALAQESGRSLNEQLVMIVEEGTAGAEVSVPVAPLAGQTSLDVTPDPKVKR